MELAASRHGKPEYVIGQSRSLPQSQLAQVPRGFCDRLDNDSTVSIGQVVLILLGLGHRAREDKAADLQVKLVRIRQEVNGTQRLFLTGRLDNELTVAKQAS